MIRSELDVLLDRVEDEALRADLRKQIDRLKQRRSFGLVFEHHIPERVRLPQHPIRIGSQVVSRDDAASPTYEVVAIDGGDATLDLVRDLEGAYIRRGDHPPAGRERLPIDSLVVITDFGEPVLPGLRYLGAVERGGDKPYHLVINGENHHALEALRFTHAGKVDCIYIDPPYNSGARDWKYNNDYVDETDAYRHSKWLAMMERRLKLAKELLDPEDSVLIVTVDENEVHRLGLLLEQSLPKATVQMVTIVIQAAGSNRKGELGRVEEYAYFIFQGAARPNNLTDDLLNDAPSTAANRVRWESLLRSGTGSERQHSPNLFYPVYVSATTGAIIGCGDSKPVHARREEWDVPEGAMPIWPMKQNGRDARWRCSPEVLRQLVAGGYAKAGLADKGKGTIWYLGSSARRKIESGEFSVLGRDLQNALVVGVPNAQGKTFPVKTVWNRPRHHAGWHGTNLIGNLVPGRSFPFPKSLYAVEDALRVAVAHKPEAVLLDFFAGSATTAHAVMRLNRQDGGSRQSIMVTNNEVSVGEAARLRNRGLRPGDPEWEALGIFEHVTRPRVTSAITGRTPDREPIKGDYKFTDEFPMAEGFEENAAFLELRYLDADDVDLGLAHDDIAPLLWLRAGAQGPIAQRNDEAGNPLPYAWTERYGVLFDEDRWRSFVSACPETATTAFIVTHSPTAFAGIAAELPTNMDTVRLPDTYLSMFLPERGRA